jgi:anti-sigma regulatory factor (Ser/Thr protein kinase)
VSEVEEYRRVSLRRIDDALVAGAVVSGVAHMLAELVENGLVYSPPDVDVEIQGRLIGDSYLIAITDQGIGMSPADLDRANQRLRGEGDYLSAPTRYLGHYVVGRLAGEMDISVQLTPSPVTGVSARIVLPPSMLAGDRSVRAAEPPPPRALPAITEVITTPPPPAPDGRIQATTIEYVTVAGGPGEAGVNGYTFESPAEGSDRTPNGLRRRNPGARTERPAAPTRVAERPGPISDSPDEVRARLNAFRSGMQRGNS